jgi:hypothetical protein
MVNNSFFIIVLVFIGGSLSRLIAPWSNRKFIERFSQHAVEVRQRGELKSADEQAIGDAITIYASFIRPKPSKIWSKIFGSP